MAIPSTTSSPIVKQFELPTDIKINRNSQQRVLLKDGLICFEQTVVRKNSGHTKTLSFWDQQGNPVQTITQINAGSVFLTKKALIIETHDQKGASLDIYTRKSANGPFEKTQTIPCDKMSIVAKRDIIVLEEFGDSDNATLSIYKFDGESQQYQAVQKLQTVWQKNQVLNLKGPYLHLSNNKCPDGVAKTWKEQEEVFKEHPPLSSDPHQLLYSKGGLTVLDSQSEATPIIATGSGMVNNIASMVSGRMFLQIDGKNRTYVFPAPPGAPPHTIQKEVSEAAERSKKERLVPQLQVFQDGKAIATLDYNDFVSMKEGYLISKEDENAQIRKKDPAAGKFKTVQTIVPPLKSGITVEKVAHMGNYMFVNFVHKVTKNNCIDFGEKKEGEDRFVSISILSDEKLHAAKGNRLYTSVQGKSTLIVRELSNP